jgi:hypothetical protein
VEHVQALGIGGHGPVLDPVVDHLDEVPGSVRATVEIALFGRGGVAGLAFRPPRRVDARRERGEDRAEPGDDLVLPADHQAKAALEPEHAAGGADVDEMDALRSERGRAVEVIAVVAVAAVDDGDAELRDGPSARRRSGRPAPPAP